MPPPSRNEIINAFPFINPNEIYTVGDTVQSPKTVRDEWSEPAFYCQEYDVCHRWRGYLYTWLFVPEKLIAIRDGTLTVPLVDGYLSWDSLWETHKSLFEYPTVAARVTGANDDTLRRTGSLERPFYARIFCRPDPGFKLPISGLLSMDKSRRAG